MLLEYNSVYYRMTELQVRNEIERRIINAFGYPHGVEIITTAQDNTSHYFFGSVEIATIKPLVCGVEWSIMPNDELVKLGN